MAYEHDASMMNNLYWWGIPTLFRTPHIPLDDARLAEVDIGLVVIGWWVATSGQGMIGIGIMAFAMIAEGIVYNAATKPKKEKAEKGKGRNRRRR